MAAPDGPGRREREGFSVRDPFTVLGVAEDAGDAEIRRRYLALVRDFPPDRAPDRFREYRAAYEALSDERKRLETKLLHTNEAALSRLNAAALQATSSGAGRATKQTVAALLNEGIMRSVTG
jgi:DnaJ-class molecular chaperone